MTLYLHVTSLTVEGGKLMSAKQTVLEDPNSAKIQEEKTFDFVELVRFFWSVRYAMAIGSIVGAIVGVGVWYGKLNSASSSTSSGYWDLELGTPTVDSDLTMIQAKVLINYLKTPTGARQFYSYMHEATNGLYFEANEWSAKQSTGEGIIRDIDAKTGSYHVTLDLPSSMSVPTLVDPILGSLNHVVHQVKVSVVNTYLQKQAEVNQMNVEIDRFRVELLKKLDSEKELSPTLKSALYSDVFSESERKNEKALSILRTIGFLSVSTETKNSLRLEFNRLNSEIHKSENETKRLAQRLGVSSLFPFEPFESLTAPTFIPWKTPLLGTGHKSYFIIGVLSAFLGSVTFVFIFLVKRMVQNVN